MSDLRCPKRASQDRSYMAIKVASSLHPNRYGILYFRMAVPADIQHRFTSKEIYRSLRTSSIRKRRMRPHARAAGWVAGRSSLIPSNWHWPYVCIRMRSAQSRKSARRWDLQVDAIQLGPDDIDAIRGVSKSCSIERLEPGRRGQHQERLSPTFHRADHCLRAVGPTNQPLPA
jgi:hypothetical protein